MSHPAPHTITTEEDGLPQLKPRPRRPFELGSSTPSSAANSSPSTPSAPDAPDFPPNGLQPLKTNGMDGATSKDGTSTPGRTRSFLNLTASTLFGIYQPSGFETESQQPTPWGTGAQTPADSRHPSFDWSRANLPADAFEKGTDGRMRRRSTAPQLHRKPVAKKGFKGYYLPLFGRVLALFGVGVLYGLLISHLHDRQQLAPVQVKLDRGHWLYLATWGFIGVALGEALPWVDTLWAPDEEDAIEEEPAQKEAKQKTKRGAGLDGWLEVVRSVSAFVGIAYAIRKLPWQSTLQLSLTLALANPAVWYLIDRSPAGFILSTIVALSGTAVLIGVNPALIPPPSPAQLLHENTIRHGGIVNGSLEALKSEEHVLGIFSQESVGVATWVASVLFISAVCFGNIGRRLVGKERVV